MAKVRINLRFRKDLWAAVARMAKGEGTDKTAIMERAVAREVGLPESLASPQTKSQNGKRGSSAEAKRGVRPIPKGGSR